jgi:hypothetical protein
VAQWFVIAVAVDLMFGLLAWRSLRRDFRRLATQTPQPTEWGLLLRQWAARMGALSGRVVPARLRIPVMAGVGVLAALGIAHFARARHPDFPPPVVVSITQSNAPLRIYRAGGRGVFLVLPDRSLWRWGATGIPPVSRAAMPEEVGTNHDWLKTVTDGLSCLGLRADGTVWDLPPANGTNAMAPQPAITGSNWVDIGAHPRSPIGLQKDGTIWCWRPNAPIATMGGILPIASRQLMRVGTASNWTAVSCQGDSYLGLREDGTLWVWGRFAGTRSGLYWIDTNIYAPVLLCADTNWVSLGGDGLARNRAGEIWDATFSLPDASANAAAVCRPITSHWAGYHIDSAPFLMGCQIRPNGTLWTTPLTPGAPGQWNLPVPTAVGWRQMGKRSDWVRLWGFNGTSLGLTADGIVWAWGYDLGHEPVVNYWTRIHTLQSLLSGQARGTWNSTGPPPPTLEESQPLMKTVMAQ